MPSAYVNLHYHIVFAVKGRRPMLTDAIAPRVHEFLGGAFRAQGGVAILINGAADHVHILAGLRPDRSLSDVMRNVKATSSGWIHDTYADLADFGWQAGYGAFTVSKSQMDRVGAYIADQRERHKAFSFEEEFVRLLKAHSVEFNEAYLWD
jgi:putative transposase